MPSAARALLVIPANNTTFEGELAALCPGIATIRTARVKRPARTLTVEDMPAYRVATLEAIEPYQGETFDLVIYGCTAAGFLAGPEGNDAVVAALSARTGVETISTASAMIEALRHDDIATTTVVTPYLAPVNDGLRRYLEVHEIGVDVLSSFECATTEALGRITETDVLRSRARDRDAGQPVVVHRMLAIADGRYR